MVNIHKCDFMIENNSFQTSTSTVAAHCWQKSRWLRAVLHVLPEPPHFSLFQEDVWTHVRVTLLQKEIVTTS